MIIKKIVSSLLCIALISASVPVSAQPRPKQQKGKSNINNAFGYPQFNLNDVGFTNLSFKPTNSPVSPKQADERKKLLDQRIAAGKINPYQPFYAGGLEFLDTVYDNLSYFDALAVWKGIYPNKAQSMKGFGEDVFITPSWIKYRNAIKDYRKSPYRNYTPYEVMKAMESETKTIGKLLKNNPRYIKELRNAERREFGRSCLQGIAGGLMLVAAVYTCGAAGCIGGAAWFGGAAAGGTLLTATAAVSLTKTVAAVVMLEVAMILGSEILDNLYDNLTDRLIKYSYIANNQYAQNLAAAAAKGSIANECTVQSAVPNKPNVTPGTRWLDDIAQEEAIIRLHGLIVIKNELQYSANAYKYDMALLDLISLFSDEQQVNFDENAFTRTVISKGEKHYQKNSNAVDTNTGRLIRRTPELIKALNAIQNM